MEHDGSFTYSVARATDCGLLQRLFVDIGGHSEPLIGGASGGKNAHGQDFLERGCRHLGLHLLTPSFFNVQNGLTCARKSQTRLGCIGVQGTPIWHGSWEPARCSCVSYSGFSSHYVLLFGQLQPPLSAWILLLHSLYCLYSKRKSGFKVTATFAGNYYFYFLSSSSAANTRAAQSCHFLPAVISFQNGGIFLTPNSPQFFSFSFLLTFLLFYLSKTEWSENKRFLSDK